ncbi:MAG: hypothetical protein AAB353_12015, partial [Candidatus Hydrogenedentota bacterium]
MSPLHAGMLVKETDVSLKTRGGYSISFGRTYYNGYGLERGYFQSVEPFKNQIGQGWNHSWNVHLRNSTAHGTVVFLDHSGDQDYYTRTDTSGGKDTYKRTAGTTDELGVTIERNQTSGNYTMFFPGGMKYNFTTDMYSYARLISIDNGSGTTVNFEYDSNATVLARLTKITLPSTDTRYIEIGFNSTGNNLITKVAVRDSTTTYRYVEYGYLGNSLTKVVTDNSITSSDSIDYTYLSYGNGRWINQINDIAGQPYTFEFEYGTVNGLQQATYMSVVLPEGGHTRYVRNTSTGDTTVDNYNDATSELLNLAQYSGAIPSGYFVDQRKYRKNPTGTPPTYEQWDFAYSNSRDLVAITAAGSSVADATYQYDTTNGRLTKAHAGVPGGSTPFTQWTYAAGSLYPSSMTDPEGAVTSYSYDTLKRITKIVAPQQGANGTRYIYDSYNQVITIKGPEDIDGDAGQYVAAFVYDSMGNVITAKNGAGNQTIFEYDMLNRMTKQKDPLGRITTYEYASGACGSCGGGQGQLVKVTDAGNNVTNYAYDKNGNMTKVTDALSNITMFEYDDKNRQTKVVLPGNSFITTAYNKLDQVTSVTDAKGTVTSYVYDHMGRVITMTDPAGPVSYTFNSYGGLATVKDGLTHVWTYTYDAYHRLATLTDPATKYTRYFYDLAGRVTKAGAGLAGTTDPTEYVYTEPKAQLYQVKYTGGGGQDIATYSYNDSGELIKITDWNSPTIGLGYEYDAAGRLTKLKDYQGRPLTYVSEIG